MGEKHSSTKDRILQAARDEFAAKGPDGARVDEIARRAGVNKERLYAHVGSKDKLFRAVLEQAFADIARYDEQLLALGEQDLPRLPLAVLEHNMRYLEQAPHFWRLLAWENLGGGRHASTLPDFRQRGYEHLRRLYRLGQKRGLYRADASFETFILLLTAGSFFYESNRQTMSRSLGRDLSDARERRKFLRESGRLLGPGNPR
ncbi:MAG TPA: TetR/AcrR family transcriptional regulator [Phycisphaerae bacterium]|nr:TetR/AcrR family transcriptional regulator [Phycisphaerae bacterium]